MNQRSIVLTVILFVLIVIGMFVFAFLKKSEIDYVEPVDKDDQGEVSEEADDLYVDITRVTAKHFYIDGVHTFAGEIPMPTPCDLLEVDANVMESMPEQIAIEFSVVNNSETCVQVVTPQRFKVSASASNKATYSATFMGRPIDLNILEAEEGETPEEFEIYIKG